MKKTIKEKTNKMYLLMLCGLLVSGAIVCSTNNNGGGGNGNGNGNGNGDPLMFSCRNGTAVTSTANNMPTMAGVENCASCSGDFGLAVGGGGMICQPKFTCPNGTPASGTATTANVENCSACNTAGGFTLKAVQGSDRMVCSTDGNGGGDQFMFACTNGTAVMATADNMPTVADEENCSECDSGFGEVAQDDGRMICQPEFTCPNGTAVPLTADNIPIMAGVENCSACTSPYMREAAAGSTMVCRAPYVCTNGTAESGTITTANVENCSECDSGFGEETQNGRTTCNALPIALWNAGRHDGDFGFSFCQTRLDDASDTIGSGLTTRGYTKAVFFGFTPDYGLHQIGSDTDALALPGPVSVAGRDVVVFKNPSGSNITMTSTFGSPTAVTRTLANVTNVVEGTGVWQTGGAAVVTALGVMTDNVTRAWSFARNRAYNATNNCTDATSNRGPSSMSTADMGTVMTNASVDGDASTGASSGTRCDITRTVLCAAR